MYRIPLIDLPGFNSMNAYSFEQLFFEDAPAIEQYKRFKQEIENAITKKKFLPIMRMCDGEYIYCIGKKRNQSLTGLRAVKFYLGKILKRHVTSWGETYTRKQNVELKIKFPKMLKRIAAHGYIANHFVYSPPHFCEEYIDPIIKWYKKNEIVLNSNNSTAFYFVYTLLNGPDSLSLFNNRNLLILSSFDEFKRTAVAKELKRRGAKNIEFRSISQTQSMLDSFDLSDFKGKTDIVLIAGGIGSANILLLCESLATVCIDSGFCLECLADSSKCIERPFCLPDSVF